MSRTVEAQAGETLCGIAIREGFLNCDPFRADPANSALTSRPLRAGDHVTVPDVRKKTQDCATEKRHRFRRKRTPEPRIRLVHGSAAAAFESDPSLDHLQISNFVTNKAGTTGAAAFPSAFGFQADGDADPDTFKVEVVSPDGGDPIQVRLEALRPLYSPAGAVTGHEAFAGAEATARRLDAECKPASGRKKLYRSRYLRLVTDDIDKAAVPAQTLLVTDTADGAAGAADAVEILDQHVRATYTLPGCKAASSKCTLSAEVPVGHDRRWIRLCVHVFRSTPGGSAVRGLTERMVRRRVKKWFRRAYAQADLAPRFVAPEVEFIDPPAADMVVIGQDSGLRASGVTSSGGTSRLSFRLGVPPSGVVGFVAQLFDPTVTVDLSPGMTPAQVGAAIVAALPEGYSGTAHTNACGFAAADPSCDVMISRDDGKRVLVRSETTTDTRLTVTVARVNLASVDDSSSAELIPTTVDFRRILRSVPGADDRLDYFVIDTYRNTGLRGRAFVAAPDLAAQYRPPAPLRWAVVMAANSASGPVMDGGDNLPFTFPHEAGHVLNDAFHTSGANSTTEMMRSGTSAANAVDASKRICDDPVLVTYAFFDPAQPTPGAATSAAISAVARMRSRGAAVMEA